MEHASMHPSVLPLPLSLPPSLSYSLSLLSLLFTLPPVSFPWPSPCFLSPHSLTPSLPLSLAHSLSTSLSRSLPLYPSLSLTPSLFLLLAHSIFRYFSPTLILSQYAIYCASHSEGLSSEWNDFFLLFPTHVPYLFPFLKSSSIPLGLDLTGKKERAGFQAHSDL